MVTLQCDKCGKIADFDILFEQKGDLDVAFLKCPECEAKYLFAVIDAGLREVMETYADMEKEIRAGQASEEFILETQILHRYIQERCQELMHQYLYPDEE